MTDIKTIDMLQKRYRTTSPLPKDVALAMAYVPFQQYGDLYDETRALEAGTLFADLDKPFTGKVNTL